MSEIDFDAKEASVTNHALEALTELFCRMPWGIEIMISDGRTMTLKKFVEPKIGRYETEEFGFDLVGSDGSHIEFMVRRTGWGSPV